MTTKDSVVGTLVDEWAELDRLLSGLSEEQWGMPTGLPGWRVTDVVAHLIGTEAMLSGEQVPESEIDVKSLPHVHNDIAAVNEHWVRALSDEKPAAMLARFREVTVRRTEMLKEMSQEEFDAPSWTPAGKGTYGRFMQIRTYDCWIHEQDIRDALGLPGHDEGPAVDVALDESSRALGYLIGKRAGAPEGSTVRIDLTGPIHRTYTVAVEGRAALVDEPVASPTVTIRLDSPLFLRLCGGRAEASGQSGIDLDGDVELGRRIIENLTFTI